MKPDDPLTPELAAAHFSSARKKAQRIQTSMVSGARFAAHGLALGAAGVFALNQPPPSILERLSVPLMVLGGLTVAFGLLRLAAAFALSRR